MKKIGLVLMILLIASPVVALKGVGIKYGLEYTKVNQGEVTCLNYGVYNPWDEDTVIELSADGGLGTYVDRVRSAKVPSRTPSSDPKELSICFDIPVILDSCDVPEKISGNVVAQEQRSSSVSGVGSAANAVVSAPLTLEIVCEGGVSGAAVAGGLKKGLNLIFVAILMAGLVVGLAWKSKRNKFIVKRQLSQDLRNNYMNRYSDLMILHNRIESGDQNPEIIEEYGKIRAELKEMRDRLS